MTITNLFSISGKPLQGRSGLRPVLNDLLPSSPRRSSPALSTPPQYPEYKPKDDSQRCPREPHLRAVHARTRLRVVVIQAERMRLRLLQEVHNIPVLFSLACKRRLSRAARCSDCCRPPPPRPWRTRKRVDQLALLQKAADELDESGSASSAPH